MQRFLSSQQFCSKEWGEEVRGTDCGEEVRLQQKLIFIFSMDVTFYVVIFQLTKSALSTVWRGKFLYTNLLRFDTVIVSYTDMANWTESALLRHEENYENRSWKIPCRINEVLGFCSKRFSPRTNGSFKRGGGVLVKASQMFWHAYYMNISK